GTLTITKTQPTLAQIAKFENIEATYNGKAVTAEITAAEGVEGLGKITVKYRTGDASATTKAPVNAGTYTVVASIAEGANYAAKDLDVGTLTIAKADRNLTELPESIELLPTDLTATLAPKYDDLDKSAGVKYQSNNTAAVTVNAKGVVTAIGNGNAVITVTLEETANYNAATATVNVAACAEAVFGVKAAEATDGTTATALSAALDGNKIVLSGTKSEEQTKYNVTLDIEKGFEQVTAEDGKIQVLYGETVVAEFEIDDSSVVVLDADVTIEEVATEVEENVEADAAANTAANNTTVEGLKDAATKELADNADAAKKEAPDADSIKVELRMFVKPLKADEQADKPNLRLELEPQMRVITVKGVDETPSEWQQVRKLTTPVEVSIVVPDSFNPTTALADHDGDGKTDEAIPVTMEGSVAKFTVTGFSVYTLVEDDAEVAITFTKADGSKVTKTYVATDVYNAVALPTDTRSGYSFKGWKFEGVDGTFTNLTEDLMAALGETATAEPAWTAVGGGGGGISTSVNTIKTAETKNGTISANANNKTAGATVTVNAKPDAGYKVAAVKVTTASGKDVAVTEQNGVYTFTMPDEDVTVSAEFTKAEAKQIFEDVATNAYYAKAVEWAVEKGITTGTTATTFSPNASCTRAQMVTFLWRAAGAPETAVSTAFKDVAADAYYAQAVAWALDNGITNGKGKGMFDPNGTVTRAESITMLFRYAKATANANVRSAFTDVNAYAYYFAAVDWAVNNGITNGTSATTFSPNADCVRAQIVTFLYRLLGDK
ncbi:MAG: S-layer homology domain-containing protein, partial [Oscillospiraceae bacterium]|nr:S-layer homology domain-containing protein [Oscillospiraceae bacterium]